MDESSLVAAVADGLRCAGWTVLIARPSQTRVFYILSNGQRKAPDLLACRAEELLVGEAKVPASALFRASKKGPSDLQCLLELSASAESCARLVDWAGGKIRSVFGAGFRPPVRVVGALVAGNAFDEAHVAAAAPLLCIEGCSPGGLVRVHGSLGGWVGHPSVN